MMLQWVLIGITSSSHFKPPVIVQAMGVP